ncbi:uncharacterized protein LOC118185442 isoform X2 [Stegodyphus dumicola]|uniref:uncharacterized protein LOC118185442 isoform X2 n=1 Tax=Stegodyphus dumicola TaxID=202533 RepID=UPI0015B0E99E|nr:uncharacterized protein LOC118185442 isoform X2 [Stegodyphus dumicola]
MEYLLSGILLGLLLWVSAEEVDMENYQPCLDHKGKEVSHGDRFFPLSSDPCTQCTCLNGKPQMCIAVFCSPPENCRQYHALSDKCCEFVCLDRDFPNKASGNSTYPDSDTLSTTNLGLRLVASTVTSFLILALLLFMIHRLRQRRLLLMIRRFHARRMDNGNAHLSRRFSEDEDGSVGYFVGHDQLDFSRYDEPPPPYTLWKPPEMYIPPGEAPPPYDLSVQLTAPYTGSTRYNYVPAEQVSVTQEDVIVHAENQDVPSHNTATTELSVSNTNAMPDGNNLGPNCSICTAADIEVNNSVNSADRAILPPDIQYEESSSYRSNNPVTCATEAEITVINSEVRNEDVNANVASTSSSCDDNVVPTTSTCTCTLTSKKGKSYKRHSCSEFVDQNRLRLASGKSNQDKRLSLYSSVNQENNNLYPDPTSWCGEASESSSSSSPTYDQPTFSPSSSDSSSADAEFSRDSHADQTNAGSVPSRLAVNKTVIPRELAFENSRSRELSDDTSKPPNFQKTLSNLKKFSLMKRKKKKRRMERPSEISCSFVCQSIADNLHSAHQPVFEDGMDLTARNSAENISRPLEAINPHIGHKLASSGLRTQIRPTSINIPGQHYGQFSRRNDGAGPSFLSYGENACCSSVVTVSGNTMESNCSPCCNASSPDSICEDHGNQSEVHAVQSTRSLNRQGISRSGSICSETGERRHHRSAGSSPTMLSRSNHPLEGSRYSDTRYASSSHLTNDRTVNNRSSFQGPESDDGNVRHIPVWIVNSVAIASRHEYDSPNVHSSSIRRSASGSFGESSRSVGDISSPLDFRDSVLSSGSSWEACSHL